MPKVEDIEVKKIMVRKTNTGREPFPYGTGLVFITEDEKGKEEAWTAIDSEGRPVSMVKIKLD